MTTDATPSYFPSVPPTFGWRRVVELADEFKVSTPDMLRICDRLGVSVADASEWLDAETVDRMRDVIKVQGPSALLKPVAVSPPPKEKPPKVKREKLPRAPAPELGSVGRDGVRLRRVFAIGVIIAALALAIGVLVERWVQDVTNTDAPATVVTMTEQ